MTKLVFTSELKNISMVDDFLNQIENHYMIDSQKLMDIKLSLLEAVNNAIIHGNQMDSSKNVVIKEKKDINFLVIHIEDQGSGFDPASIKDPTRAENLPNPGGRGIHLMRNLCDQIDYDHQKNGQTVILRFKL